MKYLLVLISLICFLKSAYAQDSLESISELQQLLAYRNSQFSEYARAADEQSGIFGNKTRKDLETSREILLQIVQTDNRILKEIGEVISRRGMAKADYSFDVRPYEETIQRLTAAADTLNHQVQMLEEQNQMIQQQSEIRKWIMWVLVAVASLLAGLVMFRRSNR